MIRLLFCCLMLSCAGTGGAAELAFDFSKSPVDQTPPGFRSLLTGTGQPAEWKIIMDEVPSVLAPLTSQAKVHRRAVLAQVSADPTDERFPILVYEDERFGDFTLTTRFKTVSGEVARMAGVVFRLQDENNFYVLRASSSGGTFRFYKVVQGIRSTPIGPSVEIPSGVWHELTVQCKGNQIRCLLNGQELIPPLTDNSFNSGKLGFWTKSDSVSYFTDAKVDYTPRETLAKILVKDALQKYPRLEGLKIHAPAKQNSGVVLIASHEAEGRGTPGGKSEAEVIKTGAVFFGRGRATSTVILPLRDRNGDPVAAVSVILKTFPGQTEQNAIARAIPIVKEMEKRLRSGTELLD